MTRTTMVWRSAAAAMGALLALAACSSDVDDDRGESRPPIEEQVHFEEVVPPDSLMSTSSRVGHWSVVAQSGELPWLAVTPVTNGPANEADVGVWQASGADLLSEQGAVEVAGDVATAQVASDGALTVIAGYAVVDSLPRTFLLTSTDRTSWEPVVLGAEVAAVAAAHVAVSDGRIHLVGGGVTGRTPSLVVHDTVEGSTTVTMLPAPGPDENLHLAGVAALGQRVVVVWQRGPKGDFTAPQVHVSDDGGSHFATVDLGPDTFAASGVVATADGFVVTGSVRTHGYAKPAAWTSPDGRSWSADAVASMWEHDPDHWAGERAAVRFTAPSHDPATDAVAALVLNDAAFRAAGAVRTSSGEWHLLLATASLGSDIDGRAVPVGERISVVNSFNAGSARESTWNVDTYEPAELELVSAEAAPSRLVVTDLGDESGLLAMANVFVTDEKGWRTTSTAHQLTYSPDAGLVTADWAPEGLPTEAGPVAATDPATGETVLLAHHWSDDRFRVLTWHRDATGAWHEGTTIDAAGFQVPDAAAPTADGWLASLEVERDGGMGASPRSAEIWGSSDGVEWTRQDGTFSYPDGLDSRVNAICDTSMGPVAVGWMQDADGRSNATAWRRLDGSWQPSVLTEAHGSSLGACASTDDGVLLFGYDGTASRSWISTDLSSFTEAEALDEGLHRGTVVRVAGGYAAGGTVRADHYVGPVLWLSPDAQEWTWVRLPGSTARLSSPTVVAVDDELLVAHLATQRIWWVPDIAAVLAR